MSSSGLKSGSDNLKIDELVKSSDLADLSCKIPKYLLKHIEA